MILVTHQISYLYGCDEVIIMHDGKIIEHDIPRNLKDKLSQIEMIERKNSEAEEMDEKERRIYEKLK